MPWKPEVLVEGKWSRNALVFETEDEATRSARALMNRWLLVIDSRAVETPDEKVNYKLDEDGKMTAV